jgi:hypothetical protein
VPPMASRLFFAHPLESRVGAVGRHSRLLGGLLRRAALEVEPRPYARWDRGRLDAVPALQLDLGTIFPLGIARCRRCRSSGATALAWHVPILSGRRGGRDAASEKLAVLCASASFPCPTQRGLTTAAHHVYIADASWRMGEREGALRCQVLGSRC